MHYSFHLQQSYDVLSWVIWSCQYLTHLPHQNGNFICFNLTDTSFDSKEIKPVNLKGNQHQIIIGRTDAEAEVPVFWSSAVNSRLIGKVPDAGKDWGQKEKKASEDEMTGWLHQCNGHELGQTWGDGEGQGSMVYCSPWGCKESDMTRQLNNN